MFFPKDEYRERWERVSNAMSAKAYEWLLVWQRGAGTFDRVGDVFWLTHFVMNGTGQDPASEEIGAPYTFSAVLMRRGQEPELHVGLPVADLDLTEVVCGKVVSHPRNLMTGLAEYFRAEGIEGRIALVGDDVLPGMYDRLLRRETPQIDWRSDESLLLDAQLVKSDRELEAFRRAGVLVTEALTSLMQAVMTGNTSAEAASRAAALIMRGGGGFHRVDIHYGPNSETRVLSQNLYGYETCRPASGDLVRAWIYGPIWEGYWLDPGRSAVCGGKPTSAQRALLEGAVEVVEALVSAMKPGVTPRELGMLGARVARKHGYFDYPQLRVPLLGHGLGTNFIPHMIPIGEGEPDPTGVLRYDVSLKPGMVMAAEIFLTHLGVGTAGFEQNVIVTKHGTELLTTTPMLFG
jgi:Xaa-Pro aminopeptidase